jgi:hypothetical protein
MPMPELIRRMQIEESPIFEFIFFTVIRLNDESYGDNYHLNLCAMLLNLIFTI